MNPKMTEREIDPISSLLKRVAPEMVDLIESRYNILSVVSFLQPIGRRMLSSKLNMTERVIRKEANTLKQQGLVNFTLDGMTMTENGEEALELLRIFFRDLKGIRHMEQVVAEKLNIKKVIVGSTILGNDELAQKEMGKSGAAVLASHLTNNSTIGITGGTTVHAVVEEFAEDEYSYPDTYVIPARGGLGKKTEYQANTLVEKLAGKINSHYKLLYTPDVLSKETIETLKNEPEIKEIIDLMERIDVLLFGVGEAQTMAKRRSLPAELIEKLEAKGAVSEGFGYYFNKAGEIVHEISTIGISLEVYKGLRTVVAIAMGPEKAEAIISIAKLNPNLILISDESTINKINELV
ncbi:MAG: sugar-binding transcriptional regulator [Clostridia bacterium]|nr:sugar-binding transcriptional regulator [Clostridia bacterium]